MKNNIQFLPLSSLLAACLIFLSCGKSVSGLTQAIKQDDDDNEKDNKVTYCVAAALGEDPYVKTPTGHAVTLPSVGLNKLVFDAGAKFVEDPTTGTATLTGTARLRTDSTQAFIVTANFTGRTSTPPPMSPKKELKPAAYIEEGGIVDASTWHYYTDYSGTLTGIEASLGRNFSFVTTGPAFQVGAGANGKNANYGASGWFLYEEESCGPQMGDFNLDLRHCPCEGSIPPIGV